MKTERKNIELYHYFRIILIIIILMGIAFYIGSNKTNLLDSLINNIQPTLTPMLIPSTPPDSPIPTADRARAFKAVEIQRIDDQLTQLNQDLKVLFANKDKLYKTCGKVETEPFAGYYMKCTSVFNGAIDDTQKRIDSLEQQRATIISGL